METSAYIFPIVYQTSRRVALLEQHWGCMRHLAGHISRIASAALQLPRQLVEHELEIAQLGADGPP